MQEKRRKCVKCGSSPADDPTVKLHRFPQPNKANKSRCELWAKFCFPDDAWQSPKFQNKLYSDHKMICDKHFKSTSFEKEKLPANFFTPQKDFNKMSSDKEQDSLAEALADIEVMVIKNEPDEDVVIEDHYVETRSPLKRREEIQMDELDDTPIKKKYLQLRKSTEESADESPMKTNVTLDVEPLEISQNDFDDSCDELFLNTSKYEQNDDCLLYGKLLTKKLRTYSVYERNLLMYKIDGLLIENPPGFDTTPNSNSTKTLNKTDSKAKRSSKKNATSTSSAVELHSYSAKSDKAPSSSSSKKKRVKKESVSLASQMDSPIEETYTIATQVTSTSTASLSPVKVNDHIPNQPAKVTSSNLNQLFKDTSNISKHPVKIKSSIQYQPIKVTSSIPHQPVKVTSSIPNKPVKVTNISNPVASEALSSSLPSHLPLQITIPETKFVPLTQSKFVASSYPKGKIVIMKSKSSKYVPSSQPPILITVPSVPFSRTSTHCDMNSLEQLSSIAATHASQTQQYMSFTSEENETADDINVVSHEVILSESVSPAQNIVETALKNANIGGY